MQMIKVSDRMIVFGRWGDFSSIGVLQHNVNQPIKNLLVAENMRSGVKHNTVDGDSGFNSLEPWVSRW